MIIRFSVENLFSFNERKELNMIPYNRLGTFTSHRYTFRDFQLLKMASIYGANGAGKSNLIQSLHFLQQLIIGDLKAYQISEHWHRMNPNNKTKPTVLAIEFIQEEKAFYYAVEIHDGIIRTEELYESGLGKTQGHLLFERKIKDTGKTEINFLDVFEKDEKGQILKSILLEEFVKNDESVFKLISNRENIHLRQIKNAYQWFSETLQILTPDSKPLILAHKIDADKTFKNYANDLMGSFNIGITSLHSEKKTIKEFFGNDNEEEITVWKKRVNESPHKMVGIRLSKQVEIVIVKEKEDYWVKNIRVAHSDANDNPVLFNLDEESDGTIRLLDFVPAFQNIISSQKVVVIDEIERSIHPILIKELIKKFSLDKRTKGQVIFTTHESILLDQNIFRQDEVWFAEKDKAGATDFYSLSEFKEHKTIDIRKGYLNGRYGSIPFAANLNNLNWHNYDPHQ